MIMKMRVIYNLIIFLAISLVTWPLYTALLIAGIFFFKKFYESVLWLVIIEIMVGPVDVGLWGHYYLIAVLIVLLAAGYGKKIIRYYD